MIVLRQKEYTRAEKEAMFQLMRLTKGFKSLPKELSSVENAKRFKKFSNRLVKFANDPETHKLSAEELKEMKGFLNDIGATKFADNFEPIVNKYYGLDNVEAWRRLKPREENLPAKALVNRFERLRNRKRHELDIDVESYSKNRKSTKGKSNKEIFSSPEGKLMKNIIKGETGGVGQPSICFNNVKGRNKLANLSVNSAAKKKNLTKEARKKLLKQERAELQGEDGNYFDPRGGSGNNYGHVFLSSADLATLSHELGHGKSRANSIKEGVTKTKERVRSYPKKLSELPLNNKADAIYKRLGSLSTIAEENMANAYGRDIIRKYGGKNADKHLANYDKFVDNLNMKSYLSSARYEDVDKNLDIVDHILNRRGIY